MLFPASSKYFHKKSASRTGFAKLCKKCTPKRPKLYVYGNRGTIYVSRYVMEQHLKRKLKTEEIVHHIDGNPLNNEITNLYLCKNIAEHRRIHNVH
jgi:hypothetical protein